MRSIYQEVCVWTSPKPPREGLRSFVINILILSYGKRCKTIWRRLRRAAQAQVGGRILYGEGLERAQRQGRGTGLAQEASLSSFHRRCKDSLVRSLPVSKIMSPPRRRHQGPMSAVQMTTKPPAKLFQRDGCLFAKLAKATAEGSLSTSRRCLGSCV